MSKRTDEYYEDYENEDGKGSSFDVRELWGVFLQYKYWFLASVIVCVTAAMVYLRYATPVFSVSSKVLIKDKEKNYYASSISNTISELGMTNSSNGFDNELEIINTITMNKTVVRDLKLYTRYMQDGKIKDREIYSKYSPYLVDIQQDLLDSLKSPIDVTFVMDNEEGTEVTVKAGNFEGTKIVKSFPYIVNTPYGTVTIEQNALGSDYERSRPLTATIYPLESMTNAFVSSLNVEASSKTTTVAVLTMYDNIPDRSVDYLNKLIDVYNEDANLDNNLEANRTRDFIEERLAEISKDLNKTEAELEQYKRSSGIVDYVRDAQNDAAQSMAYEQKIVEANTQIGLIDYLTAYVNDMHNTYQVVPSNIGLVDNTLVATINKYNEAILERERLLRSVPESSPAVAVVTNEAEGYMRTLKASLQTVKRENVIRRNDLQSQQSKYTSRISSAPGKERALADINRQQEVKAGLYLMLLQKREENLITLSSAAYKAKVIEEPTAFGPVSPKKKIILIAAFVLGLILPYLYYFISNFFRYRVSGADDLAKLTKVPMFGTVPFVKALSKGNRTIVLKENRNSLMMEVYRLLRSNLPFVLKEGQNVILFTSSTSGEGKTCIASNLGTSMAFAGKKVLLVGLDIRKPRLAGLFDMSDTDMGISNFLSRSSDDYEFLDKLIMKTEISDNLDILPAGTIPPNPAELLERENLANAISHLKQKYDYLILDTAPVGLVSDTISIAKLSDVVLYVVRANYTLKADIGLVNSLVEENRMPNMNIILNAVKDGNNKRSYRNYGGYGRKGYGYGYGYGYGNGYGDKGTLDEV